MCLTPGDFGKPLAHVQMLSQIRIRVLLYSTVSIYANLACGMGNEVFMGNVEGLHATTVWDLKFVN